MEYGEDDLPFTTHPNLFFGQHLHRYMFYSMHIPDPAAAETTVETQKQRTIGHKVCSCSLSLFHNVSGYRLVEFHYPGMEDCEQNRARGEGEIRP